jgi:hypothetical protein
MEMNFEKNLLSQGQAFFTQDQFNQALTEAKAEIMAIAIQTTRQAILIEREECAKLADECVNIEELGDAIRNRIPSQRQ